MNTAINTIAILAATYAIASLPMTQPAAGVESLSTPTVTTGTPAVTIARLPESFENNTPPVVEPVALTIPAPTPPEPRPQPVAAAAPRAATYTSYSTCGPGGCGGRPRLTTWGRVYGGRRR